MKHIFLTVCIIFLSISVSQAQETKNNKEKNQYQESLHIIVKDNVKPDIYINGKKIDFEIFKLLDAAKIESMDVIKNEKALKEYNAPNGVILIKTKKETDSSMTIRGSNSINTYKTSGSPKIIIDGKESSKENLEKLSPDDIDNIKIIKGKEAMEKYNSEPGVIIVKSNKEKIQIKKSKNESVTIKAGTRLSDYFTVAERYLYNDFSEGKAIFKNGKIYPSVFNYNFLSGEMEFINSNDTVIVADKKDLTSIIVSQDTFYYHSGYLQMIRNGLLKVYSKQGIVIKDIFKKGAMGAVNRSTASEAEHYLLNSLSNDLVVDINIVIQIEEQFFFSTNGEDYIRFNRLNIIKIIPGKKDILNNYIVSSKTDFNSREDVLKLANIVSKLLSENYN